ncbi:MAG: sensor histidine kinase [Saccharospirillum sp.]
MKPRTTSAKWPPARTAALTLPNLCTAQSVFFLVLVSELLVVVWLLLQPSPGWLLLGYVSLYVQWVVLLSAAALCRLRPWLARQVLWLGWLVAFALVSVVGFLVSLAAEWAVQGQQWAQVDLATVGRRTAAIALLAALVLRYFQLQQQLVERSQAALEARLEALQNRIRPHFLFNSLNTIAELIATRPVEAEAAVEHLSGLFRASLKESGTFWSIQDELTLVQGYLSLEQWRLGDRLRVVWRTPSPEVRWSVPVLCLQPLVENAVVHGLAPRVKGGTLLIGCYQHGQRLIIEIENPLPSEADADRPQKAGNHVALENIRHRLNQLYGDQAKLFAAAEDDLFRVRLTLPARLHNQH